LGGTSAFAILSTRFSGGVLKSSVKTSSLQKRRKADSGGAFFPPPYAVAFDPGGNAMPPPAAPAMSAKAWAMLLVLSALWGGSFFFFKVLAATLPPFTIVLGRVGLAALALNLYLAARRDALPLSAPVWRAFLVMGLLNNVLPFSLIVFGETRISSGLASILNATTPLFTVLAAQVFTTNEKLTAAKGFGVFAGFLGVVALVGPDALTSFGNGDLRGEGACLLAALSYAFAGIYGRRFKGVAPLKVAAGQLSASTFVMLPLSLGVDQPWTLPAPGAGVWLAFAGLALISTALAYVLYFRILALAGATNLLLVTFLLPISAMTLGVLFLGETVSVRAVEGMGLIGLGLAAIDGRLWRATRGLFAVPTAAPASPTPSWPGLSRPSTPRRDASHGD
jgi:drug/metabolite transporter (DMT)-like permease